VDQERESVLQPCNNGPTARSTVQKEKINTYLPWIHQPDTLLP